MNRLSIMPRPCTTAWVALLILTLASFRLGASSPGPALTTAVLALTLIKGHLVVNYFMGLRRVRSLWRIVMAAYLIAVVALIAAAYLIA